MCWFTCITIPLVFWGGSARNLGSRTARFIEDRERLFSQYTALVCLQAKFLFIGFFSDHLSGWRISLLQGHLEGFWRIGGARSVGFQLDSFRSKILGRWGGNTFGEYSSKPSLLFFSILQNFYFLCIIQVKVSVCLVLQGLWRGRGYVLPFGLDSMLLRFWHFHFSFWGHL